MQGNLATGYKLLNKAHLALKLQLVTVHTVFITLDNTVNVIYTTTT